ncbi:MAG: hypothetical protein KBD19_03360 [Candidatus Moranbacteria bacterium]|nr:hypothetical protein [Candidatus Moranbacteria bacterium]
MMESRTVNPERWAWKIRTGIFLGMFLTASFLSGGKGIYAGNWMYPIVGMAYADDDDDEDEEDEDDEKDDEDEEDEDDEKKEEKTTEVRYVTHYEVRQVPKTTVVIPAEYRTDTDGDQLVDALDPDPRVHQREYWSDVDGDAVPNVFDRHPDEDDFVYFESEYDTNGDGLVDSFEELARR